ncbi:MAG TPA: amidohydrolase family protein [Dehalococcoidia bacterium]|nr:amidohydrolase family protein [Dehalococcoidia bacterium]
MITDSQVHIWEVDRPDRPWPQPPRNQPQLPNGFSAEEMLKEMDATGVDRAVIVPPTWIGENNATALEAAQNHPGRFAVMGRFDPLRPDATEALEHWRDQPYMLGIRHTFRMEPYATWLVDGTLDPFWRDCQRFGIPVMVLVSGIADKILPVAAKYEGLKLIIDHMAADLSAQGGNAFAQLDDVISLAKFPSVSIKTSSAPCFSREPYPYQDIYPYLKRIYEAFGSHRMLWGADRTRLTSTYEECLRHFQEGLDFLSEADKEWVLGKTAASILGWPEA